MTDLQQAWPTRSVALALLLVIAVVAAARERRPPADHRLPAQACTPWMADALPGIGPVRRDPAVAAIHAGDLDALPAPARPLAAAVFAPVRITSGHRGNGEGQ